MRYITMMNELLKKLGDLEDREFYHKMKDHWDNEDFALARKLANEIRATKMALQELGWEG